MDFEELKLFRECGLDTNDVLLFGINLVKEQRNKSTKCDRVNLDAVEFREGQIAFLL